MLEPASRRLLLESLQPPAGWQLDRAVGTTYTLDLIALLAAPVAFAFSDWQDKDGRPVLDPLALLKGVRQYADRMCLFGQAGKIHVPGKYHALLADLEDSIVEARAPHEGSFHPKLWFLRFTNRAGQVLYRMLCLSRNMTFDRSWDTLLCLEGPLRNNRRGYKRNEPVSQFIAALPGMAVRPLSPEKLQWMEQLAYEIARVEFELPAPFEELRFWPLTGGSGSARPPVLSEAVDRMLVISPFIDDGFIHDLAATDSPLQLLSRGESLDMLTQKSLLQFDSIWVLDEGADIEPGEAEESVLADEVSPSEIDSPGAAALMDEAEAAGAAAIATENAGEIDVTADVTLPLLGLHAKVYIADRGETASVLTGSANATRAGFERNVEFLVELKGPQELCGVAAALGETAEANSKRPAHLADLLQTYRRGEECPPPDPEVKQFERLVDRLAQQLAGLAPEATCAAMAENGDSYSLSIHSPTVPVNLGGCRLRARPVSLPAAYLDELVPGQGEWIRFEPVSPLGLTSFFVFEVTSADGRKSRQFVLNIPLKNPPADRRDLILRHLLSDRDRVLRFLLLLLMDTGARDFSALLQETGSEGAASFLPSQFDSTLFESLVRTLDRDPERLDQVAEIIADLRKTPDGRDLLPEQLEAIWEPILEARQRILQDKAAD